MGLVDKAFRAGQPEDVGIDCLRALLMDCSGGF